MQYVEVHESTEPPTEVWVHDALAARASEIEGHGLFATRHLTAGTILIRLGGRLVSGSTLAELVATAAADPSLPFVDSISVLGDQHLVLPPGTAAHFGNHSCEPNAWFVAPHDIAARRSIAAGEEVTTDYATLSDAAGFLMHCSCGAATCRGTVTSDDWQKSELQAAYRGHWVPAIQARMDGGN